MWFQLRNSAEYVSGFSINQSAEFDFESNTNILLWELPNYKIASPANV